MCRTTSDQVFADGALAVQEALLALYEVLGKYNAVIRVKFPPSNPVARAMERNTSGWANDAPFVIQEFKHAAEDALCTDLGDGASDILDAAKEWAGHTPIDAWGREVWRKRVSIVERGLLDLVAVRAIAFFGTVWRLKLLGTNASDLIPEQERFQRQLQAMQATLRRAQRDAGPTLEILMILGAKLPGECATRIVRYAA